MTLLLAITAVLVVLRVNIGIQSMFDERRLSMDAAVLKIIMRDGCSSCVDDPHCPDCHCQLFEEDHDWDCSYAD